MAGSTGQPTQAWLPWQGTKSVVGTWTRDQASGNLGMGDLVSDGAQNDEFTADVWLDTGTWKVCMVHWANSNRGIHTIQFDGVSQGTIDGYNAGSVPNTYTEITGLSVATASAKTFKVLMATKNGSSSGYYGDPQSIALIRTSGTASTPAGTDTPGYTWQYLPWMGHKSTSLVTPTRGQASIALGGGCLNIENGGVGQSVSWDIWLDAGTYKFSLVQQVNPSQGINTVQLDAVSQGTIDGYNAASSWNNYAEITGIVVAAKTSARTFTLAYPTKNASSSNYYGEVQSTAWIRTGA